MGGRPSKGTPADGRLKSNQSMKSTPSKAKSPMLTAKKRAALPKSSFAIPAKKAYPLDTPNRARNALARVAQNGTPAEKAQVQRAVKAKYPGIDVTMTGRKSQSHDGG